MASRSAWAALFLVASAMWPGQARGEELDMNLIFRCTAPDATGQAACDQAREIIAFNCTLCHLFVRIVRKQADADGWDGVLARHRSRVLQLSDAQFRAVRDYLVANFRPDLDPPPLPDNLATLH